MIVENSSVFDRCCSKSVLPWTIFDLGDSTVSLGDFYLRIIQERDCQIEEHELEEARVGWSKEQLDPVSDLGEYSVSALCAWFAYEPLFACVALCVCVCGGGLYG